MRQVVFSRFFIFSAYKKGLTNEQNHARTREVYNLVLDLGLSFACVQGVHKGQSEASFLVHGDDNTKEEIEEICKLYDQESYLERDQTNEGYLIYLDGSKEFIGEPKQLQRGELDQHESYTILPQKEANSKEYFTFVKEH